MYTTVLVIMFVYDEPGKGVVYHYDPVGHMEKLTFSATGASVAQIQPLLDNQIGALNMKGATPPKMTRVCTPSYSLTAKLAIN